LKPKKFESAIFWGLGIHEGHWWKSVIFPKPHEDSSIEVTNKFAEEIGFEGSLISFTYSQNRSTGFSSGEYGGKNTFWYF
jgi:hypothetical protein